MSSPFSDQLPAISRHRELISSSGLSFPATSAPLVSIVIPIHNQLEYTLQCLSSIRAHTEGIAYEVIVIDDASDLSVFLSLEAIPGLRVIRNFKNIGFLHSCNRGVFNARGQYILLLNNDTEVTAGWLEALLRVFSARSDAGMVGAKLIYPDGRLQEAGSIVWRDGSAWNYGKNEDPAIPFFNYLRETDYCSGACIILPKAVWKQLAGFDTAYAPAYYEDADLAFRVRAAGYKVYYQPHCAIIHHEGKSHGSDTTEGVKRHQLVNQRHFHERWQPALASHNSNAENFFHARDRSATKKTILFIDHYVPHIDQDAGSRCLHMYIKVFCDAGFSVKFIGDNFFPHQPYQDTLEEMGVEVLTGTYMATHWRDWLAENGRYLDYVFFIRAYTSAPWIEPVRKTTNAKFLFYGVDLISRTQMRAYREFGDSRYLEEAKVWEEKESYVINSVDVSYYPSQEEVDELRIKYPQKQIEQIPLYALSMPQKPPVFVAKERHDLLFVGSFGHPPNIDALLWFLGEVMPQVVRRIPAIRIHIVGRNPPEAVAAFAGASVVFHGYVSDSELERLYRECRMAVVPLRIGGGIKGKMLEAFSKGTPVITTDIGIEGIPATDEHCAIIRDLSTFADELPRLYADPDQLGAYSLKAYAMVIGHYSNGALRRALAKGVPELAIEVPVPA